VARQAGEEQEPCHRLSGLVTRTMELFGLLVGFAVGLGVFRVWRRI
jgi:hypothetical protein